MRTYLIATNRQVQDEDYFVSFNRDNVSLFGFRSDPIAEVSATGILTVHGEHPLDMLKFATGFDAITGAPEHINPIGRGGIALKQRWENVSTPTSA